MGNFWNFFFGTPQRILVWIVIGVVILAAANLNTLEMILNRMLCIALNQLLPLLIVVGVIVYAFKKILK